MRYRYPIVIARERREFWVYIPDLPGVYGRGKTRRAAEGDIRKALKLYIDDCRAAGHPIPESAAEVIDVDTLSVAVGS